MTRRKGEEIMKKELNNKGFSLVELIIVIAIMAVLVAVLAPQFLKYVERARNSTDVANATEIVTALQVAAADPTFMEKTDHALTPGKITVGPTGTTITGTSSKFIDDALSNANFNVGGNTCKSKSNWGTYEIDVTVVDGGLHFAYSASGGATGGNPAGNFQSAMAGKGSVSSSGT